MGAMAEMPSEVRGREEVPLQPACPVTLVVERPSLLASIREAWHFRDALPDLASSMLMAQYRMTILGFWWVPITVLFATVGRTLIFGRLLHVPSAGDIPYFLFLLAGTLAWTLFDRSLMYTLRSFRRFSRVTRDLRVPLLLVPIAATAQGFYQYAMHGAILVVALVYYSVQMHHVLVPLDERILLAPLGALWCVVLAWGVGFFIAPIFAHRRDIRFVLRMVVPFLMYVTPILYPLTSVGGTAALAARLNPLATPIEMFKEGVFGTGFVSHTGLLVSGVFTISVLVAGAAFMNRFGAELAGLSHHDDEDPDDDEDLM
jgi:lipopolysaccharide transport system permease protein